MKKISILGLVILLVSALVFYGCGRPANLPNAKDLCLSELRYELHRVLDEVPIPHDEFSREYDPYPKYASSDYETRYRRVFIAPYPSEIRKTNLELASGYSLENDVRVYRSVEKAKKGFADMRPPRFGPGVLGIPGIEWNIRSVGNESKAWYYAARALDEDREIMRKQIEAEIYFRKGYVVSSVKVTIWGGPYSEESSLLKQTASFILDVARVSET